MEEIERLKAENSQLTSVIYGLREAYNQVVGRLHEEATRRLEEVQSGAQNDLRTREWRRSINIR